MPVVHSFFVMANAVFPEKFQGQMTVGAQPVPVKTLENFQCLGYHVAKQGLAQTPNLKLKARNHEIPAKNAS